MRGLLINENLPFSLKKLFSANDIFAQHVSEVGLAGQDDSLVWTYALQNELAVITKDSDYSNLVWFEGQGQVILVATGNLILKEQFESISQHLPEIEQFLESENLLYIIR